MAQHRRTVEKKEAIARSRAWQSADGITERSVDRLPPGQRLVRDDQFPILDLGVHPAFDPKTWTLQVFGDIARPATWDWEQFQKLPTIAITRDFHCVTTWSKYGVDWRGISFGWLAEHVGVRETARHVILHCADLGYTTNIPLADMLQPDVIIATELQGQPIPLEHGGPVRMIVPHLYAWKSAKFLRRIEFSPVDKPGFWETRGYHNYGDPWLEQRFG